jgi:uncharacterized protein YndB with AHSA1/START domain
MRVGSGRTHSAARLIRASAEAIYRAFMNPKAMAAWRPPEGMTMRVDAFDPRRGGEFRLVLEYEGETHAPGKSGERTDIVHGRFGEIFPDRRIVEHVEFQSDDPAFAGTMTVTTTMNPVEGGTEVTIRCDDVPEGITEADHVGGIASSLAKLARFVER